MPDTQSQDIALKKVPCDLCGAAPGEPFLEKLGGYYTRCSECDFVYANPIAIDTDQFNTDHNINLLKMYADKHYSARQQRRFRTFLWKFKRYKQLGRIMELGSSVGGFLHQAGKRGWQAIGVEPVEEVARYGIDNYGVDIRIGYLYKAGFEDGYFDAIFSNAVLEHLPEPSSVLTECARVLRPGGVLFADTVNIDSHTWRNIGKDWKLIDPRAHRSLYSPATLTRFMEKAGLEVIKFSSHGIRYRPNAGSKKLGHLARIPEELRKTPVSIMTRFNLKGDSIAVLARKPK